MVENAGVDLSDALRDLQSAIADLSEIACGEDYPREVAVARAHIDLRPVEIAPELQRSSAATVTMTP
jgi:hypothetical protein